MAADALARPTWRTVPIILFCWRRGARAGLTGGERRGLVLGCLALVVLFAARLPFNAAQVALAVQLQPARVFWMLDFLATVYLVWAVARAERAVADRGARCVAAAIAGGVVARPRRAT